MDQEHQHQDQTRKGAAENYARFMADVMEYAERHGYSKDARVSDVVKDYIGEMVKTTF